MVGFSSFTVDQEDHENSPENSEDSPPSGVFNDTKATSTSSPKRSRRAIQKRVVSVPIRDVEGSRLKGETNAPPSDSWAWRKYGQKPIKGSPYPRGYYRCSSSKGCPARKQVERSRADPTMVVVTYSCEHNHPWPASRNNHNHHHHHHNNHTHNQDNSATSPPPPATTEDPAEEEPPAVTKSSEPEPDEKFTGLDVGSVGSFASTTDQYGWFSDLDSTSMLESPLMAGDIVGDADMAMIFSIREEDESFFADLGELPECSTVFRRREIDTEKRCNLAPWCGTTG